MVQDRGIASWILHLKVFSSQHMMLMSSMENQLPALAYELWPTQSCDIFGIHIVNKTAWSGQNVLQFQDATIRDKNFFLQGESLVQ